MTAEEYYQKNALVHTSAAANPTPDFSILSDAPSEPECALHWLFLEGMSGSILDVGCGPLSLLLAAESRFERRVGVDIAAAPNWKQHSAIETQVTNLDIGQLPFTDESFAAVTCLMVIEHVFDPYHGVRELRRVCKRDGRVVIGVPNLAGIKRRIELLLGKLPVTSTGASFGNGAWDGFHLHNFTQATLDWLLRKEGLTPIRWAAQGNAQWLKRLSPALFGNDLIVMATKTTPQPDLPFPS